MFRVYLTRQYRASAFLHGVTGCRCFKSVSNSRNVPPGHLRQVVTERHLSTRRKQSDSSRRYYTLGFEGTWWLLVATMRTQAKRFDPPAHAIPILSNSIHVTDSYMQSILTRNRVGEIKRPGPVPYSVRASHLLAQASAFRFLLELEHSELQLCLMMIYELMYTQDRSDNAFIEHRYKWGCDYLNSE